MIKEKTWHREIKKFKRNVKKKSFILFRYFNSVQHLDNRIDRSKHWTIDQEDNYDYKERHSANPNHLNENETNEFFKINTWFSQTNIVRNKHIQNNGLVYNLLDQQNDHLLDNENILNKNILSIKRKRKFMYLFYQIRIVDQ
jgi:hypothetical protein